MSDSVQDAEGASPERYPLKLALASSVLFVIGIHSALFAGLPPPAPTNIQHWIFYAVFSGITFKWLAFFGYPLGFMTRTIAATNSDCSPENDPPTSHEDNRVLRAFIIGPAIFLTPFVLASGPRATLVIMVGGFFAYYAPFLYRHGRVVMYIATIAWFPLGWLWGEFIDSGSNEYDCNVGTKIADGAGRNYPCQSVLFLRNYDVVIIRHGEEAIATDLKFLDDASLSRALRK